MIRVRKNQRMIRGLKNLWRWRKVIWNDRDYDYYYIYEVLKQKLIFQRDHLRKYGFHSNSEADANDIEQVIQLIQALQDEKFYDTDAPLEEQINDANAARKKLFDLLEYRIEYWWD